jgi:predicted metal-binding protein
MTMYLIETRENVFFSPRKMNRDYEHALKFLFRDRARAKEMEEEAFKKYKEKSLKKFIELEGE